MQKGDFLCARCRLDRDVERAQKRQDAIDAAAIDEFAAQPERPQGEQSRPQDLALERQTEAAGVRSVLVAAAGPGAGGVARVGEVDLRQRQAVSSLLSPPFPPGRAAFGVARPEPPTHTRNPTMNDNHHNQPESVEERIERLEIQLADTKATLFQGRQTLLFGVSRFDGDSAVDRSC